MKELHLKILRGIEANQLLVSRDLEIANHLVFLRATSNSRIAYSINLNGGELILGLDDDRRINSIELNRSKKDWMIIEDQPLKPYTTIEGCIEFTNINSRRNELNLPLIVQTDKLYSSVKIEIGMNKTLDSLWVAISNQCFVQIVENHLRGFWISVY